MTMHRTVLSLAVVFTLPSPAFAQRFAGIMDASGMLARPTLTSSVTLTPVAAAVSSPPGFFTPPGPRAQVAPRDTLATPNYIVQPIFIPVPVGVFRNDVIEEEPTADAVFPAARRDAGVLAPPQPIATAAIRGRATARAMTAISEPGAGSTGRCLASTLRELRSSNVRIEDIRFGPNTTASLMLNETGQVRGGGVLFDGDRGGWRRFRYTCEYGASMAQTRTLVTLEPAR